MTSPPHTGRSFEVPTRSSGSTVRSPAAPTWSASSPNDQSLIRLTGALLIEQTDDWLVTRRYLSEGSMAELLEQKNETENESSRKEL